MSAQNTVTDHPPKDVHEKIVLTVLCACILGGILVAGLWPFHAPRNAVSWLENSNGLRFGKYGTILSRKSLKVSRPSNGLSCSLEIWLQPGRRYDRNTVLAFYGDNLVSFSLHQDEAALRLQRESHQGGRASVSKMYVDDVFSRGKPIFLTITSGTSGTLVYISGVVVKRSSEMRLTAGNLAGRLVVGTSPVVNDSWSGLLRGLAVYSRQLTAEQVVRHYETWTQVGRPALGGDEENAALYLFDEHRGNSVVDQSPSGNGLFIPERYTILDEQLLAPPWTEFEATWGYWKNTLINIAGFIPLGFFFCAYWSARYRPKSPAVAAIILGAAVSLTIEVLQAYLPTRDSGSTDLITNTLGTCLGVAFYRSRSGLIVRTVDRILSTKSRPV